MDGKYYNLWSTDNERTDANDEVVIKSVYDPSPVGYSLLASNAFTGFTTTGQNVGSPGVTGNPDYFNVKFPFSNGWYFYTKPSRQGDTIFFPAFGYCDYRIGSLGLVARDGHYWVAVSYYGVSGSYLVFYSGYVWSMHHYASRFSGFTVRPALEIIYMIGNNTIPVFIKNQ